MNFDLAYKKITRDFLDSGQTNSTQLFFSMYCPKMQPFLNVHIVSKLQRHALKVPEMFMIVTAVDLVLPFAVRLVLKTRGVTIYVFILNNSVRGIQFGTHYSTNQTRRHSYLENKV